MPGIPFIPTTAPFSPEQRAWLNGYLAGMFSDANLGASTPGAPEASPASKEPLLILYGSQSGTAEGLAKQIAKEAAPKGFDSRVMELNAFASARLEEQSRLVVVTSTWGEGDPPDNAVEFWKHISSDEAPRLEQLHYSVLALGDSNYAEFCGAGKRFDERLAALGAKRIHDRVDCDVDYEEPARQWINDLWNKLAATVTAGAGASNGEAIVAAPAPVDASADKPVFNRKNPYPARLITNRKLNGPDSVKDTRHFEIALGDSELTYETGDALGVLPHNCAAEVDALLAALGCDGEEEVTAPDGEGIALRRALQSSFTITKPPLEFIKAVADRVNDSALKQRVDPANKKALEEWLWGREIIDLLTEFPKARFSAAEFAGFLKKLQPRLYSISSSPKAHPGEVHLTVAAVRYESHGRARKGVCSTFLADRVTLSETPVPVFVQTSHGFRVPADGDTPIIMVGPGTGIAPFRAFLEERRATGASGRNWLFFGDQRASCDFLYRDELESMRAEGVLTRLDTAFSRDQREKIYVQDRMREHAADLWSWLDAGAHFYVCGDAKRMAKDVDAALHEIVKSGGSMTAEKAVEYVAQMKKDKRYQRDVY